jgi:hypothetical protein
MINHDIYNSKDGTFKKPDHLRTSNDNNVKTINYQTPNV